MNGSKVFTTHAPHAEVILTYVRYGPGVGGIGSVLIDTKAKGVRFGKRSKFMSGEEWAQIYFENVYVPPEMVVLKEGGFKKQIAGIQRRAHRQRGALARARPLRVRSGAPLGNAAQAVRAALVRVPGPAMEVRGHEDQARRGPAPALPRGGQRRPRFPVGG